MELIPILKQAGLADKEITVYLALLEHGPSSVRELSDKSKINRGTTYDVLKSLGEQGLVSYYHKATKQLFVAEDPKQIFIALDAKRQGLDKVKFQIEKILPYLQSLYHNVGDKPAVRYYDGHSGIKTIFSDVLETVKNSPQKKYEVFSSAAIKDFLYKSFPNFTKQRIALKITVKVIALGHAGTPANFAEVKSLPVKEGPPSYVIIYGNKVAMMAINSNKLPHGLIIEDQALSATQKQLFEYIWNSIN